MYLAKVIGTIVSTNRNPQLSGLKLLMIKRLTHKMEETADTDIAVDAIGAGVGEIVIVTRSGAARVPFGDRAVPVDATIVEIADIVEVRDE